MASLNDAIEAIKNSDVKTADHIARQLMRQHEYEEAERIYQLLLGQGRKYPGAYCNLIIIRERLGDYKGAREAFEDEVVASFMSRRNA